MSWDYSLTEQARKDLLRLSTDAQRRVVVFLKQRIKGTSNPRAFGKPLKGSMAGLWRYRVGDYRVICQIQDRDLCVLVAVVSHRSNVYR